MVIRRVASGVLFVAAACGGEATESSTEGASTGAMTGAESTGVASNDEVPTSGALTGDGATSEGATGTTGGELPAVVVLSLEVAQTHVLPDGERTWQLSDGAHSLHVVGGRSLLALVELGADAPEHPALEVRVDDEVLGVV